ncbi:uncharacterized protein [Solanum lycopersicum]|uniref:uncharacterized protein n=1 Tax=Solanum lycopersicum TaxID=4081 RepID=UPI000050977F|nr:uncharacterized protein LOC101260735 [Solanum lycopersicum]XP_025887104.1 uncharacterized protein LOC101260735 [Solanum lycopersicum]
MDADERLKALEKAYTDVVLNTEKEAATRIMVSEQKAQCFQEELQVVKEKGLMTLMKLKEMMDSKIIEAELTSLSQQRKIEELESQLEEAEDIVSDLRVELREVQAELEKVASKEKEKNQSLDVGSDLRVELREVQAELEKVTSNEKEEKQSLDVDSTNPRELKKDNTVVLPPESQDDSVTTSNMEVDSMNQKTKGYHSCHTKVNPGNCFVASSDLSLTGKALELHQNGHTQIIHAAEGNLSDREIIQNETFSEHSLKLENMTTNNFLTDDSTVARGNAPSEDSSEMAQGLSTGKGEQVMEMGYAESSDNKPQSIEASGVHYEIDEHEDLMGKMDLSEEDIENVCNQLFFIKDLCNQLLKSESSVTDVNNRVPSQPINDRVFKYTYKRKRKRELLSVSDEKASIAKSSQTKNMCETR